MKNEIAESENDERRPLGGRKAFIKNELEFRISSPQAAIHTFPLSHYLWKVTVALAHQFQTRWKSENRTKEKAKGTYCKTRVRVARLRSYANLRALEACALLENRLSYEEVEYRDHQDVLNYQPDRLTTEELQQPSAAGEAKEREETDDDENQETPPRFS
ncbi:hypothetical protein M514_06420 [Trichuris suis]|uniref:Uncharacterized protein n=1 Tax=Trichuris suis TaxID=68888 RepID=A0A085MT20_9BILA|nr:hypothetical protein M514_06420 [Trichuris suis]